MVHSARRGSPSGWHSTARSCGRTAHGTWHWRRQAFRSTSGSCICCVLRRPASVDAAVHRHSGDDAVHTARAWAWARARPRWLPRWGPGARPWRPWWRRLPQLRQWTTGLRCGCVCGALACGVGPCRLGGWSRRAGAACTARCDAKPPPPPPPACVERSINRCVRLLLCPMRLGCGLATC